MSIFDNIKYPPKEFSPAAFWFWYGDLKPDELRRQIDLMVQQGVYNGFMHSRAYLKTPYLEDGWWDAVSACVDEGEKTGFFPWLYDEYAWPSGTAGNTFDFGYQKPSKILAKGRVNMAKSLVLRRFASSAEFLESADSGNNNQELLCLFCGDGARFCPIDDASFAEGEILAFYIKVHSALADYMNKETIREFMDYTHEEYKKRFGEHFGKRIPGVFFDEIYMNHFAPWTDKLPEEFISRRGYDLMPLLWALAVEGGEEERKIRRDFYKTVAELYEEAFFAQIGDWCEENNLKLTGHTEEELWLHPARQGNYFNTLRHLQIPGADCHDYRYRLPRKITYREGKLAVSVARAYGKERAMSEAFGGAGWACTLQEFKRGVNVAGAMGISMFTLHGFYSEIDHQGSQGDWPGNFFFQNPYWRYFKHFADYISRVCYMNSQGKPMVDTALYYPIGEMQDETYIKGVTPKGKAMDSAFNTVLVDLIENQIDVDIIDGESLLKAEVSGGRMSVGNESFSVLLLPDIANLGEELAQKLEDFKKTGGKVIYYSTEKSADGDTFAPEEIHKAISEATVLDVCVVRGDRSDLYINHRKIDGKDFYFVANGASKAREITLLLREIGGACKLCAEDGEMYPVSYTVTDGGTLVELSLDEDEGAWIVVDPEAKPEKKACERVSEEMIVRGRWDFLPVPDSLGGEEQIRLKQSEMQIPIAMFSSSLHPEGRQIRIQNKAGESGHIGRHLSPWSASWITRRVGWKDNCSSQGLYFRRRFTLDKKPDSARLCLAAVNDWRLFINGNEIDFNAEGLTPKTVDITEHLSAGDNVIGVFVRNKTPLPKATILELEEPLPQMLISLIAELEMTFGDKKQLICTDSEWKTCESATKDWMTLLYEPDAAYIEPSSRLNQAPVLKPTEWSVAWERGKPPIKPFGNIPLFGKYVNYPQKVCYGIELPCGTIGVRYPSVSGDDVIVLIDGMPVSFKDGVCTLTPDGNTHYMQVILSVNSEKDGLHDPVTVMLAEQKYALGDWRLHGLKWYSGFATYKNSFEISKKCGRYELDMGQVCHGAEVYINGKRAGERVWEPYRFDVTELLKDGKNEIAVIVCNSAGVEHQFMLLDEGEAIGWNRYWNYENMQREGEKLISGLIGPVKIYRKI